MPLITSIHHCNHSPWWLAAVGCISGWWQWWVAANDGSSGWQWWLAKWKKFFCSKWAKTPKKQHLSSIKTLELKVSCGSCTLDSFGSSILHKLNLIFVKTRFILTPPPPFNYDILINDTLEIFTLSSFNKLWQKNLKFFNYYTWFQS